MSNIDKRALRHSAESIIGILENIAGFEPSDIDGDSVETRFETEDGFDTGCDVSIVDQCQKTADVVRALLDELERNQQYIKRRDQENEDIALTVGKLRVELEAAKKRIAELEAEPVSQTYKLNELSGNSPVTPDGWVMVPKRLTAENGAKGALSGEFSETTFISCPECFGDDDCDTCDGSGRIEIKVPVTWTTIKSIWDKGIAHFAAKPPQEVNRG